MLGLLTSLFIAAPNAGASWLEGGTPVATAVDYQINPTLVPDGHGGAILAWEDGRSGGGYFDIYAQHVDSAGVPTWIYGGYPVCTATNSQLAPVLVADGFGGAIMFWSDYRAGHWDVYGQTIGSDGVALWSPGGIPICNATGDQGNVAAIGDGNPGFVVGSWPGAILAWTDSRLSSNNVDVYVQHIDRAGGGMWAANGVRLCDAPYGQYNPALATDGSGFVTGAKGAVVVWEDYRLGFETPADIYAGRVTSGGVVAWGSGGVPVCTAEGGQGDPRIANVGAGSVIVSWTDSRPADHGIYAQKLDAAGAALWATDGISVCSAPRFRSQSRIIPDGAGGAIIVWMDYRNDNWDIYAQRVDATGALLWGHAGKPVCSDSAGQALRDVIPDGAGGAIALWEDARHAGLVQVYVQRLDANGTPLWPVDGIRVAPYAANQMSPRLAGSGIGNAIIAWQDWRGTFYDIYASRVTSANTVDVPAPAGVAFRVALAGSNPVRGPVRFSVDLPEAASLTVEVIDALGRRVRTIERGARFAAGTHRITWDGADGSGSPVGPGIYFLRVSDGARTAAAKVVALR